MATQNPPKGRTVLVVDLVTKSWTQLHSVIFEASEAIIGNGHLGKSRNLVVRSITEWEWI